jgi:membrane protease YdiL (CAAX protease family)
MLVIIIGVLLAPGLDVALLFNVGELLFLIPILWLSLRKYNASWRNLGLRDFSFRSLVLGIGLLLLSFVFNLAYSQLLGVFDLSVQPDFSLLFEETSSPWLVFLAGVVIAPVIEEIIFRGFIFAGLVKRYGWQKAALISAIIFALIHMQPLAFLPIVLLGLIFSYLYFKSGSIWPAVAIHMITNALGLGAAYFSSQLI